MMKKALLAAAALAVSGVAFAQQSPSFYVAATGGVTSADIDCEGASNCDKRDTGWKVLAGVKVTPNFAIEVQAHNFGEVSLTIPQAFLGTPTDARFSIKGSGYGAGIALSAPLSAQLDGFVRVGVASNKAKASLQYYGSTDETSTKPYYGIGLAYRITSNVSLRAELEGTNFEIADESTRATMVSAGVSFSF